VGELKAAEYRKLRDAGADRYLLKFETSDARLYARLRPGCRLSDRLKCLHTLRSLGYQVGSGNMVGLPGQSLASIAKDIELFRKFDLDMIGIGPFIAHPNTPLAGQGERDLALSLKTVALTRLYVPRAHIPATTASGTIDSRGREKALVCGANVVMPNLTPVKYRRLYQIYPNKVCMDESPEECYPCLRARILSLGRTIASTRGDSLKR
jgi:biotin synthase